MMLPPANNQRLPADAFAGPAPFKPGDFVEVMDKRNGEWMPATVFARWSEVDIPSGIRRFVYDVDGYDDFGAFHGRFDDFHIRQRKAGQPETHAGGKT